MNQFKNFYMKDITKYIKQMKIHDNPDKIYLYDYLYGVYSHVSIFVINKFDTVAYLKIQ